MSTLYNRTPHSFLSFFFALTALALTLAGCATQPAGSQSFALAADYPKSGKWSLKHLGDSGRIELTAHPDAFVNYASRVAFQFGNQELQKPKIELKLADGACTGAYTLALARTESGTTSVDYLATKLRWDEPLQLRAEWRKGLMTVTVNGDEARTVPFSGRLGNMQVEVDVGSVRVDDLSYRAVD